MKSYDFYLQAKILGQISYQLSRGQSQPVNNYYNTGKYLAYASKTFFLFQHSIIYVVTTMSLLTAPGPAPPPPQPWLAKICRQFAATRLLLTPAPAPGSRDLNTGLWLVITGHVTRMLVSDWSRVWPSQHRSQLWAEKRAPAERIPVSIWEETGDHRVSSECQLEKWRLSSTEEQAELSIISSRGLKIIWRTVRARCQH